MVKGQLIGNELPDIINNYRDYDASIGNYNALIDVRCLYRPIKKRLIYKELRTIVDAC